MRRRLQGTRGRKQVENGKVTIDDVEIKDENYWKMERKEAREEEQ